MLRRYPGWISERRIAERLAAETPDQDGEAIHRHRIELRHVHLPELADRGHIVWNEGEGTACSTESAAESVAQSTDPTAAGTDMGVLADDRRRAILAIVDAADGTISREHLAREVASRTDVGCRSETTVEEVAIQLHHNHLPRLEEAGLIHYNSDDGFVTYSGSTALSTALTGR